jgi:hypothetical protein
MQTAEQPGYGTHTNSLGTSRGSRSHARTCEAEHETVLTLDGSSAVAIYRGGLRFRASFTG